MPGQRRPAPACVKIVRQRKNELIVYGARVGIGSVASPSHTLSLRSLECDGERF